MDLDVFLQDFQYGLRSMRRNLPTFVLAILIFSVGIGATSAVFAVVNSVLLRPLPFAHAGRLAMIWAKQPQLEFLDRVPVSAADFADWQRQNTVFEKLAAIDSDSYALTGLGQPEQVSIARVTKDFFSIFGASTELGRTFLAEEDQPNRRVAVVGYDFWRERLGGDPRAVGKSLMLNDAAYQIVGVVRPGFHFPQANELPAYFEFPSKTQIWVPLGMSNKRLADRRSHDLAVIGLLKSTAGFKQARAEMDTIARRLEQQYPDQAQWGAEVVSLSEQMTANVRAPLLILQCAVTFVLLIACTNVASLLLARGSSRRREIAIRCAIGASPGRIVRQLLTESVMLALAGGAVGVVLAHAALALLAGSDAGLLPRGEEIRMDYAMLGFAVLISVGTGLAAGVLPAAASSKQDLAQTLKEGLKGSSGGLRNQRTRGTLVILQLAIAFLLSMSAGILVRSYQNLMNVSPGFQVSRIVTFEFALSPKRYPQPESQPRFFREVMRRVSAIPGVDSAGVVSYLPLKGEAGLNIFRVEGRPAQKPGSEPIIAIRIASQSYFQAMRIPLLEGRLFAESDGSNRPLVAVVNQSMARTAWPNGSALNKRLLLGTAELHHGWEGKPIEVIGVVGNVKPSLEADDKPQLYLSQEQVPWSRMVLAVRTRTNPDQVIGSVNGEVHAIDSSQPVLNIKTMQQYLDDSVANRRYGMSILGAFAAGAVLLATIGLYGLLSYNVAQQRKHVAIRMSLGAQKKEIIRLVVTQGMILAVAGLAAGGVLYWIGTSLLRGFLFGVTPADSLAASAVSAIFLTAAFLACYFPARRSVNIDPLVWLREE